VQRPGSCDINQEQPPPLRSACRKGSAAPWKLQRSGPDRGLARLRVARAVQRPGSCNCKDCGSIGCIHTGRKGRAAPSKLQPRSVGALHRRG